MRKTYISVTKISPMNNSSSTEIHGPYDTDEKANDALAKLAKDAEMSIKHHGEVEEVTVTSHKDRDGLIESMTIVAGFHDEGGYSALSTVVCYHLEPVWIGEDSLRESIDEIVSESKKAADEVRERATWKSLTEGREAKLNELADTLSEAADKVAGMLPDSQYGLVKEG